MSVKPVIIQKLIKLLFLRRSDLQNGVIVKPGLLQGLGIGECPCLCSPVFTDRPFFLIEMQNVEIFTTKIISES